MRSPVVAVLLKVSSQCFIELSVTLSFFLWNVDIHSSLFTLKSCKSASGFRKIVPVMGRSSTRLFFISVSMFPGCAVGCVDRCEEVKIPAIFSCPSDFSLGCTKNGIVAPSEFNGVLIVFSCTRFSVFCFSNGIFAFGFRRVLHLLSNKPARGNGEQS